MIGGAPTVNPDGTGTKAAAWYTVTLEPGETAEIRVRAPGRGCGSLGESVGGR